MTAAEEREIEALHRLLDKTTDQIEAAEARGFARGVAAAAAACEAQVKIFLSPEYAVDQPLSSIQERFACGQCAAAIRALAARDGSAK